MRPDGTDAGDGPRPVRVVVVGPDERVDEVVARHPGAAPSFNRTLRIALAMRGGVSLAVWIGGAVSELDLLRRIHLHDVDGETIAFVPATPDTPPTPATLARLESYARMLDASGYDRVEFDLLAGASAGGLNAVVYAVAQRAGTGLERLLDTWGRVGGFWRLLHPPGSRRILALMQGEGYFRSETMQALTEIYDSTDRHPDLVASYTGVDLSATVIDGSDEFEESANEGRGHFHFVGSDAHHLDNVVPSRGDHDDPERREHDLANLDRLALAARSTSSLPGGFEPAYVDSYRGGIGDPAPTEDASGTRSTAEQGPRRGGRASSGGQPLRSMRFAFAAHREQAGTPYRVVDGAVFDNVPIERALRAARTRFSERRADRAMLFLDPEPDPPLGGTVPWDPNASRFFRAIGAMLSRQFRKESVSREVAELERFNAVRSIDAARLQSAAPLIAAAIAAPDSGEERRRAYVRALGAVVADQLAQAVSAPSEWQLETLLVERRRYRPIERVDLAGLTTASIRRFTLESANPAASAHSITAVADAANCVLGWTRALESVPERGSRRGLAFPEIREAAYAALRFATDERDRLIAGVLEQSDRLAASRTRPQKKDFDAWIDRWVTESARIRTTDVWRALDLAVARLRLASIDVEKELDAGRITAPADWTDSAWRPLAKAPSSLSAVDLPPLYHASGIPAALSHVRYWPIGVDEQPDGPAAFTTLASDRWHSVLQHGLRRSDMSADDVAALVNATASRVVIDRQTKLAGYGFGNFLGFLAREWRINDWWWGRLDAAAGLARFFGAIAPDRIDVDEEIRVLQDAVLEDADRPETHAQDLSPLEPPAASAGRAPDPRARRARLRAGTDTIANLSPSYRFAIASRTVRLLDRVVVQPVGWVLAVVAHVVLAILRPVLVVSPTLFDPPRLALVSGFVAAVAWLLTWEEHRGISGAAAGVAVVTVLAFVAILAGGVAWARTRWQSVVDRLEPQLKADATAAERRAWGPTVRMAAATLASLLPLTISILEVNVGMAVVCWFVSVVFTVLTVQTATTVRRAPIPGRGRRTGIMLGWFGLLGGVLPLVQFVAGDSLPWLTPPSDWNLVVLAVGATAVSIALTAGWLRIGRTGAELAATHGLNWITVTVLAVAAGALGWLLLLGVVSSLGAALPKFVGDVLLAMAFIVAWANALWWLPEWRRWLPPADDRVQRAPLA